MTSDDIQEPEEVLKSILILLKLSGFYHGPRKCSKTLHIIYGTAILLLTIGTLIGEVYCVATNKLSSAKSYMFLAKAEYIARVPLTLWCVVFMPNELRQVLVFWKQHSAFPAMKDVLTKKYICFFVFAIIVTNVMMLVIMGVIIHQTFADNLSFNCFVSTSMSAVPQRLITNVYSFMSSYQSVALLLTYMILGRILQNEYRYLKKKVEHLSTEKKFLDIHDILILRKEHGGLCSLLDMIDLMQVPYSCFIYAYGVVFQCLAVYALLYEESEGTTGFLVLGSSFFFIVFLLAGTTAAAVHSSTKCLLESLLDLNSTQLTRGAYEEVQMLMTKLTSESVGFSLIRLFTLSKSTVLTIVGTMISYVILAVQFNPNDLNRKITTNSTVNA